MTDRARRSIVLAQEHAREMGHDQVGTGHILVGLLAEGEAAAYQALAALGADLESARATVSRSRPHSGPQGHVPFTPRGKRVLELSLREAIKLSHNYVGTEHILLALIREAEHTGQSVLVSLGIRPEDARVKVLEVLRGYGSVEAAKAQDAEPDPTPAGLVELAKMLADLEGYIERRAAELAAPAIKQRDGLMLNAEANARMGERYIRLRDAADRLLAACDEPGMPEFNAALAAIREARSDGS